MKSLYDRNSPKKAVNLTVNSDLLKTVKKFKINLSFTLEKALVEVLLNKRKELWMEANKGAITSYNERVEKEGTFSDGVRNF